MDLSFNLAPSYRDLKDPTTRQNFDDTPGQIPKLILTLRPNIHGPNQICDIWSKLCNLVKIV